MGININEPPLNSLVKNCDYQEPCKVRLKYERLKNFCFYCAHLDHEDRDCPEKNVDREDGILVDEVQSMRGFNSEMKADLQSPKLPHEIFHARKESTGSEDN